MNKKMRARAITKILNDLFPNPPIPLKHHSHFTLLIAVLLSARCTDARVNKITPQLFKLADTPEKMSQVSVQEIEDIIRPCGLPNSKANNISKLSKIIVEKHNGHVPKTIEELEELPGVGHKTASVVMIQAYKQPAFPVDTHIHRLAKRWKLSNGKNVVQTERDLKKVFPESVWCKLHLQMIYFGRQFCPARGHKIEDCPICSIV